MPHLDLTITLGNIIELAGILMGMVGIYYKAMNRFSGLEQTLTDHAGRLTEHSSKMGQHENELKEIFGQVQNIMGRLEIATERRSHPR